MFASPETIVFAVRALITLGSAARDAYEQHVRDADISLADLPMPDITPDGELWKFYHGGSEARRKRVTGGDLKDFWHNGKPKDEASRAILVAEAIKEIGSLPATGGNWAHLRLKEEYGGTMLLSQWAKDAEPPSPLARIALAFADVALEYINANPGILGVGGNGEKLIGGLAGNLNILLPNVEDKSAWARNAGTYHFAERLLTIVLHAGLKTIGENPKLIVSKDQYQKLLGNVLKPLVERFESHPNERPSLIEVRDLLAGPMAQAALETLHADPRSFLGRRFDPNEAIGAVTAALLGVVADSGIRATFSDEGLLKLYRAALGVVATRPELIIKGAKPKEQAARDLLGAVAAALKDAPKPFDKAAAADLGVAALQALQKSLPRLLKLDPDKPWENVAGDLLSEVLAGFAAGLQAGSSLEDLFTAEDAFRLVAIFLDQAAETPGMITGDGANPELKSLVQAVAAALGNEGAALLTADGWTQVARAVAAEAARNPARLLELGKSPGDQLLAQVLGIVLSRAAIAFKGGRATGALLFGETLSAALGFAVRAAAGNAARAESHVEALGALIDLLDRLIAANPKRIGAREWLYLFERHVAEVLDRGLPTDLTHEKLLKELEA